MNRLKELRRKNNCRQADIAGVLGVGRSTYTKYEAGAIQLNPDALRRLARYYGVSADYILGCGEESSPAPQTHPAPGLLPVLASFLCPTRELLAQAPEGYAPDGRSPDAHFFCRARDDAMAPEIKEGDLVLIGIRDDVQTGDIAAVVVNEEEELLRKVLRTDQVVMLTGLNPECPPRVFVRGNIRRVRFVGKAVALRRDL